MIRIYKKNNNNNTNILELLGIAQSFLGIPAMWEIIII